MIKKMSEPDSWEELDAAYEMFNPGPDGIAFEDLQQVARELGEDMTDEELREMIEGACRIGNKNQKKDKDSKDSKPLTVKKEAFLDILNKSNL